MPDRFGLLSCLLVVYNPLVRNNNGETMKNLSKHLFLGAAIVFSAAAFHAEALLPPFFESLKEYSCLLNSPELSARLGSADMLRDIERTDTGFLITSLHHTLKVDVVYDTEKGQGEPEGFVSDQPDSTLSSMKPKPLNR